MDDRTVVKYLCTRNWHMNKKGFWVKRGTHIKGNLDMAGAIKLQAVLDELDEVEPVDLQKLYVRSSSDE